MSTRELYLAVQQRQAPLLPSEWLARLNQELWHVPGGIEANQDTDRCESTEILPSLRRTSSRAAKKTPPFSRGHDFIRLFGTTLATD
jgi:hypothetical protein